ncbi:MAG: hypothetical protein Q8N90_00670 [bacterium]|nr:hypothetical protein [bacterium]
MPYIAQKNREQFDPLIDQLAEKIVAESKKENYDGAFAGFLNYVCTRLALKVIRKQFGKLRYWLIATVVGTFHNVADEFFRRLGGKYEDKRLMELGDVDLYKEYSDELDKEIKKLKEAQTKKTT